MKHGHEKKRKRKLRGFVCINCKEFIAKAAVGTAHRNHCPLCLWSKHLDRRPGDRSAACGGAMEPIGLTFKAAGEGKVGELMVVHRCQKCGRLSKNRIAGDDREESIVQVFKNSVASAPSPAVVRDLESDSVALLGPADEQEVLTQLYGKPNLPNRT